MAVKKAGQVLVDLLIGKNEIPEEAERARRSLQRLGEAEKSFYRLARAANQAGIEIGNRLDYIAAKMERNRDKIIASIEYMANKATTASKMIDYLGRFASPLRILDQQFLKIGDRLERIAREGQPAVTALRMLGPNASMLELVKLIDHINQGITRMRAVALSSLVVFGAMTVGMVFLSNAIDGRLIPATKRLGKVWAEALEPFTHVWTDVVLVILKAAEAVGRFFAELAEAHPVLSSMIWGFMYLLPLVTLFLAPLAIAIDRTNALRVAFYALWQTIKPFVLGFLSIIGTAMMVTAAIVGLSAAIAMMWKYSAAFRKEVVQTWTQIKSTIAAAVAPIGQAFEQLKTAFLNFVATLFGAKPTMTSIWKEIGNAVASLIDYLAGIFLPVIKVVFQAFATVVSGVFNVVTAILQAATAWWKQHGDTVIAVWQSIWATVSSVVGAIVAYLVERFQALQSWWQQVWPTVRDTVVQVWNAIWALVTTVVGDLFGFLQSQTGNFKSFWESTWPAIEQTVVQIWNAIWPVVKTVLADAVTFILNALNNMRAWWNAHWPAIQQTVMAVWNALWPTVKAIIADAAQFIIAMVTQIRNWFLTTWPIIKDATQNVWTIITTIIKVALTTIMTIMQVTWPLIQSIVVTAWNAIKSVIQGAVNIILGVIKLFASILALDWQGMWEAIKQIATGALQALWGLFNLWFIGRFVSFIRGALVGIKNVFVNIWNGIVSFIQSVLSRIYSAIVSRFGAIIGEIRAYLSMALNAVRSFHNSFFEAGRNLIEGLARGIASMASAVIERARSIAQAAINTIKNALAIFSPSRVMIEIGAFVGEGLVIGMDQMVKNVSNAAASLAQGAHDAIAGTLNVVATVSQVNTSSVNVNQVATAAPGVGAGHPPITINIAHSLDYVDARRLAEVINRELGNMLAGRRAGY